MNEAYFFSGLSHKKTGQALTCPVQAVGTSLIKVALAFYLIDGAGPKPRDAHEVVQTPERPVLAPVIYQSFRLVNADTYVFFEVINIRAVDVTYLACHIFPSFLQGISYLEVVLLI